MDQKYITIQGARENNLKNVSLKIPKDKLVIMTGVSGSGKTSLAFDTIYAEGQRRYMESLSAYARQFLGNSEKPDVDQIDGLSPAIAIDQKTTSNNPRSTVGTVTEIYDYLRLLYARIGTPHCTKCGREITQQTVDQIVDRVMELDKKTRIQILAPIVKGRKGEFVKELDGIRKSGFVRVRVDGSVYDLSEEIKLEKNKKHNIDVIVDRLVINDDIKSRLTDSVETATHLADGNVVVDIVGDREELFSLNYACPEHGAVIEEMSPRMFSFNNPFGACKKCGGLGSYKEIDPNLVIPNKKLSINQGAVKASGWSVKDGAIAKMYFEGIAKEYGFSLDVPVDMIPKDGLRAILYGTGGKKLKMKRVTSYGTGDYQTDFEGVIPNLKRSPVFILLNCYKNQHVRLFFINCFSALINALSHHGVCNLFKACNVGAGNKVVAKAIFLGSFNGMFVNVYHSMVELFINLFCCPRKSLTVLAHFKT